MYQGVSWLKGAKENPENQRAMTLSSVSLKEYTLEKDQVRWTGLAHCGIGVLR